MGQFLRLHVGVAQERREASEENISDNTNRPDQIQDGDGEHDDAHDDSGEGDGDHACDVTTPTDLVGDLIR